MGTPKKIPYGIRFTDEGAAHATPPSGYLDLYVNSDKLYAIDDSGTIVDIFSTAGGNTLDASYDQGGSGSGRTVTVDSGAITLNNAAANNNGVLAINKSPTGAQSGDLVTITAGAQCSGDCIQFSNSGSGNDLAGSGGTWSISPAGAITAVSISLSGPWTTAGITNTGAAVNLNASSNYAVNVATGTSTGAVTLGGGLNTVAVNSSSWKVSTAGAVSGITTMSLSGDITMATGKGIKSSTTIAETVGIYGYDVDGAAYVPSFLVTNGNNPAIAIGDANQTVAITTADWGISAAGVMTGIGAVTMDGLLTASLGATISGATINLNASSNFAVNIGTGTTTGTVTIGGAGTQTIAIGDGAAAKTVSLGSSNTTSTTTILSGSGGINLNVDTNQPVNIGTGTSTGTVTIGGAGAQSIAIGDGAAAKTVTLGSSNTTSTTTLLSGSGGLNCNVSNNQPTNINSGTSTGAVTIGGTGVLQIDVGAGGTGAKTINIGDGASTGTTSIKSGSGGLGLNVSTNQPVNIGTGTCTGTVTIGGAGAQTINIGDGAAAKTVTLGSVNTTSTTTISAGSGGINLAGKLILGAQSELTIASDAITVTKTYHSVDTESDDATDDLVTINGGAESQLLVLRANNSGRSVVLKHASGNIQCGADITLDNANDTAVLIYDGSNWLLLSYYSNGA